MAKRKKNKKHSYIIKDPFNFFASLIVVLCLLLKELFLYHECGIFGVGLYNACFICLGLFALIFILSVKESMEKAVFFRKHRGQIKNALQFIRLNSVFAFWIGIIGAVILFFLKDVLCRLLNIQALGSIILVFFSFALPFLLVNASFIGAFDAWGYKLPLNSGLIVFSVSDFLFSLLCSVIVGKLGGVNSALFHNEHIPAAFSGGGAALGFLLATVITSVWLSTLYKIFRKNIKIDLSEEFGRNYESIHDQRLGFFVSLGIPALKTILAVVPFLLCMFFAFYFYPETDKSSPAFIIPVFGTLSIHLFVIFLLPMIFSGSLAKYAEDSLKYITARDDRYHGGMRLLFLMKQFLCFILPVICFTGMIAGDLTEILFDTRLSEISLYSTILFSLAALSMLLSAYIKGFELTSAHIICKAAGIAAEAVFLIFVVMDACTVQNLIISMAIYFGCVCLLDLILLNKFFVYKKQFTRHFVFPLVSCGIYVLCVYLILMLKDGIGFLPTAVLAFTVSFLVQSVLLVLTGAVKENELPEFPQKMLLTMIGRMAQIYR